MGGGATCLSSNLLFVIKEYKASRYTIYLLVNYLLVNTILRITLNLQMLYRQLEDQQVAPPTIFISGAKSSLTKPLFSLHPFLDQKKTIYIAVFVWSEQIECQQDEI